MKGRVFRSYVSARAVGERVHTKGRKKDTLELPFVQERTASQKCDVPLFRSSLTLEYLISAHQKAKAV